jgi:hypothetical protein
MSGLMTKIVVVLMLSMTAVTATGCAATAISGGIPVPNTIL